MILVDTSIWTEHLRSGDRELATLLQNGHVIAHPWVIGELALVHLSRRIEIIGLLSNLQQARTATHVEVLAMIEDHRLFGRGIGYIDAHLLASTLLTTGSGLWTRDKRLAEIAGQLAIAYPNQVMRPHASF